MGDEVQGGREESIAATRIDLFTVLEVRRAKGASIAAALEIITPAVMSRIDAETGQQNNTRYMAYRLMYIASRYHA